MKCRFIFIYLWRKLGSCVKKWSSGTSSLRSNSTNHAQLGSEQKLNRVKSKLAFAKFNYIYQELSESKQKGPRRFISKQLANIRFTCLLNRNVVLQIAPRVRPIFFHSGHVIGSGDMCHQIKHVRFFEKMSFSQLRGSPEKVGGHIFM